MIVIRKAEPADVPAIVRLLIGTWPSSDRVRGSCSNEVRDTFSGAAFRPTFFVAQTGGQVVGCGAWNWSWLNYGFYEMCWGVVADGWRGLGIGRRIVEARMADIAEAAAKEGEDHHTIMLSTHLRSMYERYGFRSILESPGTLNDGSTHLMMKEVWREG